MSADRKQHPAKKNTFIVAQEKKMNRAERRAAKRDAKKGIENTDKHLHNAAWYD